MKINPDDHLPKPFAWINIPAGKVTLVSEQGWDANYIAEGSSQTFDVPTFAIAKYPLTNAQYAKFIAVDGYREQHWWTQTGWEVRQQGWAWNGEGWEQTGKPWSGPRYWTDSKWNQPDYPVVGISWFEAAAFCRWLSETTEENISLPTEHQWQRAAQGDNGWAYPWGNTFDPLKCNSAVGSDNGTSPVMKYEGKGDSPFGVVDMSGNVWEWCINDYDSGATDVNVPAEKRVLRGGAWYFGTAGNFRCVCRYWNFPYRSINYGGLRLALS